MAATVCRLEAGAPSRYDARLGDQREKLARTRVGKYVLRESAAPRTLRMSIWRDGRAVDCSCLENSRGCKLLGGSNPSPSAKMLTFERRVAVRSAGP